VSTSAGVLENDGFLLPSRVFREHSGNIQATFREHSGNIHSTFRAQSRFRAHSGHFHDSGHIQGTAQGIFRANSRHGSGHIQGTFKARLRAHSGHIQGTSGNIQGTGRIQAGHIQGTFRERSGNVYQGTFRERLGNIQGTFSISARRWSSRMLGIRSSFLLTRRREKQTTRENQKPSFRLADSLPLGARLVLCLPCSDPRNHSSMIDLAPYV
jgi:hypothetical protein